MDSLPQKALKHFKVGEYIYLREAIVEVRKITVSKTGKHGHCRATLTGRNIETQKNVMYSGVGDEMNAFVEPKVRKWVYVEHGEYINEHGASVLAEILEWPEDATVGDAFSVKCFAVPKREVFVFCKWEVDE